MQLIISISQILYDYLNYILKFIIKVTFKYELCNIDNYTDINITFFHVYSNFFEIARGLFISAKSLKSVLDSKLRRLVS